MRGHTHAQEVLPLLPTGIRVPRGHAHAQGKDALEDQFVRTSLRACHAQGRDLRFREGTDPRAPIYCGRHAPRGRPTECSEVAAAFEHWGERVEGSSTATWATCAAANSAPTRPWRAVPACCVNFCQVGLVCVREVTPWFPTRYFPSRRVPWSGEFIVGDDACV